MNAYICMCISFSCIKNRYDSGGKAANAAFGFEPSAALLKAILVNSAKSVKGVEPKPTTTSNSNNAAARRLTLLEKQLLYDQQQQQQVCCCSCTLLVYTDCMIYTSVQIVIDIYMYVHSVRLEALQYCTVFYKAC
jgi:hypothetical protein